MTSRTSSATATLATATCSLINAISDPTFVHSVEANQMAVALAGYNG